jgi:hypothetical protein
MGHNPEEGTQYSVNYLTGKIKVIESLKDGDKTIWKSIKNNNPKYLDEITSSSLLEEQY